MAQFIKYGNAFYRVDDKGAYLPITDPDTNKGLQSGQLPYTNQTLGKPLSFSSGTGTAVQDRGLEFGGTTGTPSPYDSGASRGSGAPQDDVGSLIKAQLIKALTSYQGATNTAELESKRQSLLRQQLLASPYSAEGEKNLTGSSKLALLRQRGSEFEPQIKSIENQILKAREGDEASINNLTKIASIAESMGLFKDEEDVKHSPAYYEWQDAVNSGYKGDLNQYMTEDANRKRSVTNINASGLTPGQTISFRNAVIDDFRLDPAVQQYTKAAAGWTTLSGINTKSKTSADDIAAVYAFAKIMDPDSVVREGEYATIQKYAQSWAQAFGFNALRVVANTEFLSPAAVENLKKAAASKMKPLETAYQEARKTYEGRLTEFGGNSSSLPNYGYAPTSVSGNNDMSNMSVSDIVSNYVTLGDNKKAYISRSIWQQIGSKMDALLAEAKADGYTLLVID